MDSLSLLLREGGRGKGYNSEFLICRLHDGGNQCGGPGAGAQRLHDGGNQWDGPGAGAKLRAIA